MKQAFYPILLGVIAACSAPQPPQPLPKTVEIRPSPNTFHSSPDGRLYATIRHNKKPYTIAIIERESGRVRGVAESSANIGEQGDEMYGSVRVTYSDDSSTIVVHEDFSDASPNPRYILFQRPSGATAYRVSHFAPPTAHTDDPGEFDFVCPRIQRVTSDAITLDY